MRAQFQSFFFFNWTKFLWGSWAFLIFQGAIAQKSSTSSVQGLYFPPVGSSEWEKTPLQELGWNQAALAELLAWLPTQDTRGFIVLKGGRIVLEEYWGSKLTGLGDMDQQSLWYWDAASFTLTAALTGIAQQEGFLSLKDRTQKYLGIGWSAMPDAQEKNIQLIHHLTFTTGINDKVSNLGDTSPSNLTFLAKPGSRWSYHPASHFLVERVLENATGKSYESYWKEKIGDKIGMKGLWQKSGQPTMLYSDTRSFARFGLLMLAEGNWAGNSIWSGKYFKSITQTSQKLNKSYGFFTWLNGQESYLLPGMQQPMNGSVIPSGPEDMFFAVGKNGQFLMVIPSKQLVIVRMGGAPGDLPVPYLLMRQFWDRMSEVLQGN
uniref:serine hydrolase domain-containing protein n=1 Tax=Algoriphagus sp. TaxID=1872435 RepID=UPI002589AC0D|nr:serine hydrolase domain-containing protein [Algoriphagus sp.]